MEPIDYELNEHLRFKNVNEQLAKKFGTTPSKLEGERFDILITQECAPNFLEAALDAFRGDPVTGLRIEMIQKQRKKIDVEMSLEPLEPGAVEAVRGLRGKMRFLKNRIQC